MESNKSGNDQNHASTSLSQMPHQPYRFTNDELRILRQCNRESFYQRSLPISGIFSIGTYYAVKTGYWKGHPRFGPTPKVLIAATVGYFVGKFSYQSKCAEKLMQLSNSPIGEMLRQRKRQGGYQEILADHTNIGWSSVESTTEPHDWNSDRPVYDGFDDFSRPSLDTPILEEDTLPPPSTPRRNTSYDELRMKNREEYEQKKSKLLFRPPSSEEPITLPQQTVPDTESRSTASWPRPQNKYGDVWEE